MDINKNDSYFRLLPGVDSLLSYLASENVVSSREVCTEACREAIEFLRVDPESREGSWTRDSLTEKAAKLAIMFMVEKRKMSLRRVVNATGIVLHTNLGRAVLSENAVQAVKQAAESYSNLEYDLAEGKRGSRYVHTERLLKRFTNAEASIVVNNNAAAVFVAINSLAKGREVIISRGQLVEIGDTFRIPEIISLSGAILREVGTTNRTRISDFENAINENTALILYVHPSNYSIQGFAEDVTIAELCRLGKEKCIPTLADLGSGCLFPFEKEGFYEDSLVSTAIQEGCDIITFSGDKLLGGPQAGIIAGKQDSITKIKSNPIIRTLRIDKLTLAALEATLIEYTDMSIARTNIPTIRMLTAAPDENLKKANVLKDICMAFPDIEVEIESGVSPVGGGSMPMIELETSLVKLRHHTIKADDLVKRLRHAVHPVITYIREDHVVFDVRTIQSNDFVLIEEVLAEILKGEA